MEYLKAIGISCTLFGVYYVIDRCRRTEQKHRNLRDSVVILRNIVKEQLNFTCAINSNSRIIGELLDIADDINNRVMDLEGIMYNNSPPPYEE